MLLRAHQGWVGSQNTDWDITVGLGRGTAGQGQSRIGAAFARGGQGRGTTGQGSFFEGGRGQGRRDLAGRGRTGCSCEAQGGLQRGVGGAGCAKCGRAVVYACYTALWWDSPRQPLQSQVHNSPRWSWVRRACFAQKAARAAIIVM